VSLPPNHLANHPERKRIHDIVTAALRRGPGWIITQKWDRIACGFEIGESVATVKLRSGGEVWLQHESIGDDGHIPYLVRGTGNADRTGTIHLDKLGAWLRVQNGKV